MGTLANSVQLASQSKRPGGRTRRLAGDEEDSVLAACQAPQFGAIVSLAIEPVLRRREILSTQL